MCAKCKDGDITLPTRDVELLRRFMPCYFLMSSSQVIEAIPHLRKYQVDHGTSGGLSGGGGLSVEGTDGNKYNKEKIYEMNKKKKIENDKRKYFSDIYADMTLMTW